jgi:fumarylacetoacetase
MRVGDLLGSGTISGTEPGTQGSLLEQIEEGKVAMKLNGGEKRKFLLDGDTIEIRGWSGADEDALVGFGSFIGKIDPAVAEKVMVTTINPLDQFYEFTKECAR